MSRIKSVSAAEEQDSAARAICMYAKSQRSTPGASNRACLTFHLFRNAAARMQIRCAIAGVMRMT
jgi:hypothetical protein